MKFRVRQAGFATVIVTVLSFAGACNASDGTITFMGAVTANSCTVDVNGTGSDNGTIALPVVDTTALDASSGTQDAGGTYFDITLGNCSTDHADLAGRAPTQVAIYFEAGPTVDAATNGLINSGTSNVEVKLYLASETSVIGNQITPGTAGSGQPAIQSLTDTGTQRFYAAYSLPAGVTAQAGTVVTTVTYSLVYN